MTSFTSFLKRTLSPQATYAIQMQRGLWKEGGVLRVVQFNRMLVAGWLRERLTRHRYRSLSIKAAVARRKSDTVFIFGSGASLNDLQQADWEHFRHHDVFGFNAFYQQRWIPVDFHLLRVGIYGALRWRPFAEEVGGFLRNNPLYGSTIYVLQSEYFASFCNQLMGYGYLPEGSPVLRYRTARGDGPPSPRLADGIRHTTGTLADTVHVAYCLGWKRIVLVGVDLYDSRYFYLPPDATPGLDERTGVLGPSEYNTFRGNRYDQAHYTARKGGVIDLMRAWRTQFEAEGVELQVYNPRSLLTEVLPVYDRSQKA